MPHSWQHVSCAHWWHGAAPAQGIAGLLRCTGLQVDQAAALDAFHGQQLTCPLLCLLQGSDFLHLPLSLVLPLACVMRMGMAEVQQLAVGDADMRAIFDDVTAPIAQVRGRGCGVPACAGCSRTRVVYPTTCLLCLPWHGSGTEQ